MLRGNSNIKYITESIIGKGCAKFNGNELIKKYSTMRVVIEWVDGSRNITHVTDTDVHSRGNLN